MVPEFSKSLHNLLQKFSDISDMSDVLSNYSIINNLTRIINDLMACLAFDKNKVIICGVSNFMLDNFIQTFCCAVLSNSLQMSKASLYLFSFLFLYIWNPALFRSALHTLCLCWLVVISCFKGNWLTRTYSIYNDLYTVIKVVKNVTIIFKIIN